MRLVAISLLILGSGGGCAHFQRLECDRVQWIGHCDPTIPSGCVVYTTHDKRVTVSGQKQPGDMVCWYELQIH